MDIDKTIAEASAKLGISLNKDDPLFVSILLNKVILNEYVDELNLGIAESITRVAIKEDVTLAKLRKLLDDDQVNNRKETERVLNQFSDNLTGRLHSLINTVNVSNNKPASWVCWLVGAFCLGLFFGGMIMYYFIF